MDFSSDTDSEPPTRQELDGRVRHLRLRLATVSRRLDQAGRPGGTLSAERLSGVGRDLTAARQHLDEAERCIDSDVVSAEHALLTASEETDRLVAMLPVAVPADEYVPRGRGESNGMSLSKAFEPVPNSNRLERVVEGVFTGLFWLLTGGPFTRR